MLQFAQLIANLWRSIIDLFDIYPIIVGQYSVSVIWLIFAFLVIGFVVSFYWKGARS